MKVMFAFGVCVASFPVLWSKSIPQETHLKQPTSPATHCILILFTHHLRTKVVSFTIALFFNYLIYLTFKSYLKMALGH